MGTLYNQPDRNYHHINDSNAISFIERVKDISKKEKITFAEVLQVFEILENKRRNDLYVANGDILDEHMAGLGELVKGISSSVSFLAESKER
jgi:hypothetical protein